MSISKLGAEQPKPWAVLDDGYKSGFGFGTESEWGQPLFCLYDGTPEQVSDVVRQLNSFASLSAMNEKLVEALGTLHRATIEPTLYMSEDGCNATQKRMRANALDRYADACELTVALLAQSRGEQS